MTMIMLYSDLNIIFYPTMYYFSNALSNPIQLNGIPYIRKLLRVGVNHKEILYFRYTRQIIQNVSSSV